MDYKWEIESGEVKARDWWVDTATLQLAGDILTSPLLISQSCLLLHFAGYSRITKSREVNASCLLLHFGRYTLGADLFTYPLLIPSGKLKVEK